MVVDDGVDDALHALEALRALRAACAARPGAALHFDEALNEERARLGGARGEALREDRKLQHRGVAPPIVLGKLDAARAARIVALREDGALAEERVERHAGLVAALRVEVAAHQKRVECRAARVKLVEARDRARRVALALVRLREEVERVGARRRRFFVFVGAVDVRRRRGAAACALRSGVALLDQAHRGALGSDANAPLDALPREASAERVELANAHWPSDRGVLGKNARCVDEELARVGGAPKRSVALRARDEEFEQRPLREARLLQRRALRADDGVDAADEEAAAARARKRVGRAPTRGAVATFRAREPLVPRVRVRAQRLDARLRRRGAERNDRHREVAQLHQLHDAHAARLAARHRFRLRAPRRGELLAAQVVQRPSLALRAVVELGHRQGERLEVLLRGANRLSAPQREQVARSVRPARHRRDRSCRARRLRLRLHLRLRPRV